MLILIPLASFPFPDNSIRVAHAGYLKAGPYLPFYPASVVATQAAVDKAT